MARLPLRAAYRGTLCVLLLSCGGDSPTPPGSGDEGQPVVITVTTTGVDLDDDGYTVRLGVRSAMIVGSGTATFDDVAPGSHDVVLEGVANNCLVDGTATRMVSVTPTSGASTSFAVDCGVDFSDGNPTVACQGLDLAASGRPFQRIPAGTVPATLSTPIAARILAQDPGAATGYAWFESDGQGGGSLVVPLHPAGRREGGKVWIRVGDGEVACPPVPFTIEALPGAPGEMGRAVVALQEILRQQAAILETTPEILRATALAEVAPVLIPLWTAQWGLDHPDNPNSLRRVSEGTSGEPVDLDLLDAVLADIGFAESLVGPAPAGVALSEPPLASASANPCTPQAIGGDGDELARCMLTVRDLDARLLNWAQQLSAAVPTIIRQWDLIQQAPGIARAVVAGLGWTALQADTELHATLPSQLTSAEVDASPMHFTEDDTRTGAWTLKVTAASMGWDPTRAAVENFTSTAIDLALAAYGVQQADYQGQIHRFLGDAVTAGLQDLPLPAETFGPAEMKGNSWSDVSYRPKSGGGVVAVNQTSHHTYAPSVAGTAVLEVTTPGSAVDYGGPSFKVETDLVVDSIVIIVNPSETFVAPGARNVPFTVGVLGASNLDALSIDTEQGTAVRGADAPVSPGFYLNYNPPASPSFSDPDSIHVEYTGRTGPAATSPRRFGFAIVRFGEIIITPQPACLDTLEQTTFSAEVRGVDNRDVTWSAAFGTIDSNGNYRAPATRPAGGVDTITATSVEEPKLMGEIVVPIGCTCNFRLTLGNQVVSAEPGDQMVFNTSNGRIWQVSATRPSQGWSLRMLPVDTDPMSRPDTVGIWPMVIQGDMGLTSSSDVIYATNPPPTATLDLTVFVPNQQVRGTVNGPVEVVSTTNPRTLDARWSFSIRYEPGEFTCTVGGGGP